MKQDPFIKKMESDTYGYKLVRETGTKEGYVGLRFFIYTVAIVTNLNDTGYADRYCYHGLLDAIGALEEWRNNGYIGRPEGWHKAVVIDEYGDSVELRDEETYAVSV